MKRMTRRRISGAGTVLLLALLLVLASQGAAARPAAPQEEVGGVEPSGVMAPSSTLISYQGTLTDQNGAPLTASVTMQFRLYDAASGGNVKWGPESQSVQVTNGLFNVLLGSVAAINPANLTGDLWLDIRVNGEQLTPRERITSAPYAVEALTLPDGATTRGDLTVGDKLTVHGFFQQDTSIAPPGGTPATSWREDGDWGGWSFQGYAPSGASSKRINLYEHVGINRSAVDDVALIVNGSTSIWGGTGVHGDLYVDGSVNCGALTEANLETPEERSAGRNDRFEAGDVLCWGIDRLELCATPNDRLVQAVADSGGRPIVIGAEPVRVLGPVERGDILVASGVAGYAMVNNDPAPGSAIAQALEDFAGDRGIIKAMIRKF
jgi:hypothetical protein